MGNTDSRSQFAQPALYRILDANLDRTREGLRVVEEWCRFGLNDAQLTQQCKHLRQELALWHTPELRAARNTPDDPGTELTHSQEEKRDSIEHVLQVNFCRIQEALRVLEEYGKVYSTEMAATVKQMRYQVYTLESSLMIYQRHQKLKQASLYLVTSPSDNLFATIEAALQGGLAIVQYRDKETDDQTRLSNAHKLQQLCHEYGALFIVNDRVDLALAVNADGVHLGQQDMPLELARQLLGHQRLIGRSTTNPDELDRAIREGADYVGVGPVYATPTKAGKAAAGIEYVQYAANHCPLPWFAIGGIDIHNVHEVISAGAQRIAVVRAIMQAEQPILATQYFSAQMNQRQILKGNRKAISNQHQTPDLWE
ncbi:thiamine phosphate synthase [Phormidesmis priestleyi]|uniref:thiamine phosphate synthase n=1 Tax=Phormidesmis priestleyi TaxID=268141 RepID=UPI00083B13D6|nr:thiamine phosphate synthase [Phormidesmis priestleyi]